METLFRMLDVSNGGPSPVTADPPLKNQGLAQLFYDVILTSDGAALGGTLEFLASIENTAPVPLALGGLQLTANQTGWAFTAGNLITFTTPPAGETRMTIRYPTQPRYLTCRWTQTSGTAAYRLRVVAWGFGQGCTP